jgi:23S rRNA (cytosine1962-C5)-methyltransferase
VNSANPSKNTPWITQKQLAHLQSQHTTIHRVYATPQAWIDRYEHDFLITATLPARLHALQQELLARAKDLGLNIRSIYGRTRRHNPKATDLPTCIFSTFPSVPMQTIASEMGLRYRIDFNGYSCGFFLDQRHNRSHLAHLAPKRLLNTFAYTGSFSLVAAKHGAETWTIDLSPKAIRWAKENFKINNIDPAQHHFYADDVLTTLPRLHRRGLTFDAIILDPPTFSRDAKGRCLRTEKTYPHLIELAAPLLAPHGSILLSTNATSLSVETLKIWAKKILSTHTSFYEAPLPQEIIGSPHASSLWCIKAN